ncbi:Acid shock protein 2 precursor [Yersinia enterocolitica]|nr:Acid shock protein 2 precursor [Yersinia enterocolitica]
MKKVLALIVAATMGLSSVAFAAETTAAATAAPAAPAATSTTAAPAVEKAAPAKATHHKNTKRLNKLPNKKHRLLKKL